MKFPWRARSQATETNSDRAVNPDANDPGEKISQRAVELQRVAAAGLTESEAFTALGAALGNEVAAMIVRRPAFSVEELLDIACESVREAAHCVAGLSPNSKDVKKLTEHEFDELTARVVKTATTKTLTNDAICATAKALGVLISFSARQEGRSMEELIKFSQESVANFAHYAATRDAGAGG